MLKSSTPPILRRELSGRTFALVVVLAAFAVSIERAWALSGGWFIADDFMLMTSVTGKSFADSLPAYLTAGHLSVLPAFMDWASQRIAPYSWPARVFTVAFFQFVGNVVWCYCTARLLGRNLLGPLIVTFVSVGPLTLTAYMWWANAASSAPLYAASAVAVLLTLRRLDGGHWVNSLGSLLIIAVFLAGTERTALLAGLIMVLPFLHGLRDGLRTAWLTARRHIPLAVGCVASLVAYIATYAVLVQTQEETQIRSIATLWSAMRTALITNLAGGPLHFSADTLVAWAYPKDWWLTASLIAVAVAVLVLCWPDIRALIPIVMFALVWVAWAAIVLSAREWAFPDMYRDWRILADTAMWLIVTLAISISIRIKATPQVSVMFRVLWAIAATAWVVVASVSTWRATVVWSAHTAKAWVETATENMRDRPWGRALNLPAPMEVFQPLLPIRTKDVFGGMPDAPPIGEPTGHPLVLDYYGMAHSAFVQGGVASATGPAGSCGWPIKGKGEVTMAEPLYGWNWLMRVDYVVSKDTVLTVSDGSTTIEAPVKKGAGQVYAQWEGPIGGELQVNTGDPAIGACIGTIAVGDVGVGGLAPREDPGTAS